MESVSYRSPDFGTAEAVWYNIKFAKKGAAHRHVYSDPAMPDEAVLIAAARPAQDRRHPFGYDNATDAYGPLRALGAIASQICNPRIRFRATAACGEVRVPRVDTSVFNTN